MPTATQPVNAQAMASRRAKLKAPWGRRVRIAAELRRAAARGEIPHLGYGQFFAVADAFCDEVDSANDANLDAFIGDCCDRNTNGDSFTSLELRLADRFAGNGSILDIIGQLLPILLPMLLACFGA